MYSLFRIRFDWVTLILYNFAPFLKRAVKFIDIFFDEVAAFWLKGFRVKSLTQIISARHVFDFLDTFVYGRKQRWFLHQFSLHLHESIIKVQLNFFNGVGPNKLLELCVHESLYFNAVVINHIDIDDVIELHKRQLRRWIFVPEAFDHCFPWKVECILTLWCLWLETCTHDFNFFVFDFVLFLVL